MDRGKEDPRHGEWKRGKVDGLVKGSTPTAQDGLVKGNDGLIKAQFLNLAETLLKDLYTQEELDPDSMTGLQKRVYNNEPVSPATKKKAGRGRPAQGYEFADGTFVARADYDAAKKHLQDRQVMAPIRAGMTMTETEFDDFCRLALPEIGLRMVKLAMVSDKLKEVQGVFESLSNRAYGRPTQSVAMVDPNKDIRAGWVVDVSEEGH